jgi:DNA polymerase elongation subunit (family B)
MRRLLCVYSESLYYYKTLFKRLEKDSRVAQLFNTELSHIQQYLFTKLRVEPTCKVQVKYDNAWLISLTKMEDHDVQPPPFTILYFEVITYSSPYYVDSYHVNNRVRQINARYQEEPEVIFDGSEEETILKDFTNYVLANDPDILISAEQHRGTSVLKYLFARMEELGIDMQLDRTNNGNRRNSIEGRICLDRNSFDNLTVLIERARFACLPLASAARYRVR